MYMYIYIFVYNIISTKGDQRKKDGRYRAQRGTHVCLQAEKKASDDWLILGTRWLSTGYCNTSKTLGKISKKNQKSCRDPSRKSAARKL